MGLPLTGRLTHKDKFSLIKANGEKIVSRYFLFYYLKNGRNSSRLGVVVSAKFGDSVLRHRVKRLFREAFRRHIAEITEPVDIIVIPRNEIKENLGYFFIEKILIENFKPIFGNSKKCPTDSPDISGLG